VSEDSGRSSVIAKLKGGAADPARFWPGGASSPGRGPRGGTSQCFRGPPASPHLAKNGFEELRREAPVCQGELEAASRRKGCMDGSQSALAKGNAVGGVAD
jgi:hypothetical protein